METKKVAEPKSVSKLMYRIRKEGDTSEIDYWNGFSQIILESQRLRYEHKVSQQDLAALMDTKQSVISRFENMGRLPSYDFIARLAAAFDHAPGMTLFGEYMAVAPSRYFKAIDQMAESQGIDTAQFVQDLLERALEWLVGGDDHAGTLMESMP